VKQADIIHVQKGLHDCLYSTLTLVVSPDSLSLPSSTSSAMKTSENSEEDPDDLVPAGKYMQVEYSCN